MLKRKIYLNLLIVSCVLGLIGCGKSEEEQAAEYYEEQLGMSSEEAEELANSFYGEEEETEEKEVEFTLYEASDVIQNSNIADGLVQINEVVLKEDGSMTLDKAIEALQKSKEGENFTFVIDNNFYQSDGLVDVGGSKTVTVYRLTQEEYEQEGRESHYELCRIIAYNPTNEMTENGKLLVVNIEGPLSNDIETPFACNVFYSGNINMGQYRYSGSTYAGQNVNTEKLTYDNILEYLENQGFSNPIEEDITTDIRGYKIKYVTKLTDDYYVEHDISFAYSMETREITNVGKYAMICNADAFYMIDSFSQLTDEEMQLLMTNAEALFVDSQFYEENWATDYYEKIDFSYTNKELYGCCINRIPFGGQYTYFIYKLTYPDMTEKFVAFRYEGIKKQYNGTLQYGDYENKGLIDASIVVFDSIEELLDYYNLTDPSSCLDYQIPIQ